MKKYLILIAGSPATGKTFLINLLKETLKDIFVLTPDEGKEILADSVGFDNLNEKAALEKRVWKFYYGILGQYMEVGKRIIVSEYPFSYKQRDKLSELAERHDYQIITIRLVADFEILWQRRKARDVEADRHLSHIMSHYHFGDELIERGEADNLITKNEFKAIIEARQYHEFALGDVYEFDVSDFSTVDYEPFLKQLKNRISHNQ